MTTKLTRKIAGVYEVELPLYGLVRIIRDGRHGWSARQQLGFVIAEGRTLQSVYTQLMLTITDQQRKARA